MFLDGDPFTDLSNILQHITGYVCAFDRERRLRWINALGYGHTSDAIGQRAEQHIDDADRPAWLHAMRLALDDGVITQGVCRVHQPDGGPTMRMAYRTGPLRCATRIIGAIVINWDVTFERAKPAPQPLAAFLLTDRCRRIVEFLHANGPQKGMVIGRHLGEMSGDGRQAASKVRITLSNLEERNVVRHTPSGYAVTPEFIVAYVAPLPT